MSLSAFRSVRLVGGILPADALTRAADLGMPGQSPDDYELTPGVAVTAAVARSWSDMLGAWQERQRRLSSAPGEAANRITRDRWLLPLITQLGYGRVPSLPAGVDLPPGLGETTPRHYPISHQIGWPATEAEPTAAVAVHLVADTTDLDKRTPGIAARAPHGMVQEFINHSERHLYAVLANGNTIRLLRDASSLTRQSYVEFDLDTMFSQQLFADFRLMWLVLHATRLAPKVAEPTVDAEDGDAAAAAESVTRGPNPAGCWLELWRKQALSEGTRARDALEAGVAAAITALGTGFVSHPANDALREALRQTPELDQDMRRWLLRCVYRFIVLFVAEDRELLHPHDDRAAAVAARELYTSYFGSARLRRLAATRAGTRHSDLWPAHLLVTDALGADGSEALAVPALAESLYGRARIGLLGDAQISNRYLLAAVRHLSQVSDRSSGNPVAVDYRHLDSEELGSVYEGLLAYTPRYDPAARTFTLATAAGSERKKSGSYYTATDMIALVLDEALNPVIDQALRSRDPASALLALKVCDPACGSGHFLVAAARRIAAALAVVRTGEPESSPSALRSAMRDVIATCIYGVDLNDLAIEVAKVALWLEALTPGKPLAYLDHHLKVGNALIGTTPALLRKNIPDDAFSVLDGDDKTFAGKLKRRNKEERENADQASIFDLGSIDVLNVQLSTRAAQIEADTADTIAAVRQRADAWRLLEADGDLQAARLVADAWCSAFIQPKRPASGPGITHATLQTLQDRPDAVHGTVTDVIRTAAREHRFFHWHLEFPGVFIVPEAGTAGVTGAGWTGGFSCVVGNPPWEGLQFFEEEFFAALGRDDIAKAGTGAKRGRLIAALESEDEPLYASYQRSKRRSEGVVHLLKNSGRYPLTGSGRLNTYSTFAETFRLLVNAGGQAGLLTPTGLATDNSTAPFFADAFSNKRVRCFYDFVNGKVFFPAVDSRFRFALSVFSGTPQAEVALAFRIKSLADLQQAKIVLTPEDVLRLNPNTGTLAVFGSTTDAEITLAAYRRHPILIEDNQPSGNPWRLSFMQGMFNMTSDSNQFVDLVDVEDPAGQALVPLYEGKHVWHYDHRFATSAGALTKKPRPVTGAEHLDASFELVTRYYVKRAAVQKALSNRWDRDWLLGFRDITNATNERTFICSAVPRTAIGNKLPLAFTEDPGHLPLLQAVWSSLAFDYIARQKVVGTSMNFYLLKQFACPTPEAFQAACPWQPEVTLGDWVLPHVLELTYTSEALLPYAEDLGDDGRPFRWDAARRSLLMAELDGAMLHVYGWSRREAEHVLDSFLGLKANELSEQGEFLTKRLVLDAFDRMATWFAGEQAVLVPPAGRGPRQTI